MASRVLAVTAIVLVVVMVMVVEEVPVAALTGPPQPISCTVPNTSMISPNYCDAYDEQRMDTQTQACQGFLTNFEAAPSTDCCIGLTSVAFNRTACICKLTFFPPAAHNASRQLQLPSLCGVGTNLCGQCPTFLVSRSNGTAPNGDAPGYSEGDSTASTIGAISLAVVFGVLLVGGIAAFVVRLIKKRKAKKSPPAAFETPPPGGAF